MNTALEIALAVGTVLSLVLHYVGRKHPDAEKAAEYVDEAEDAAKKLAGK
jgi:hypothetical protein